MVEEAVDADDTPPGTTEPRQGRLVGRDPVRLLARHPVQWLFLAAACAALVLLARGAPADAVLAGAGILVAGTCAVAVRPEQLRAFADRGGSVELFGIKAGLPAVPRDGPTEEAEDDHPARNLVELRFKLDQKLTYLAKHVLGTPTGPASLTLGSMVHDGQLPAAVAETCALVTALRTPARRELRGSGTVEDWLVEAQETVASLRIEVLSTTVRTSLRRATDDGRPRMFSVARPGGQPEVPRAFVVRRADGEGDGGDLLVVPVFSQPGRPIFERTRQRVERLDVPFLMVCPPRLTAPDPDAVADSRVVQLPDVVEAVGARLPGPAPRAPEGPPGGVA